MENISKIHLAFENCEGIDLAVQDVSFFIASDITETIRMDNILAKETIDRISRYKTAKYVRFIFNNKPEYERIFKYNDIAQIHLYDKEGNHEWFYVDYDEEHSMGDNKNQKINNYDKDSFNVSIGKHNVN